MKTLYEVIGNTLMMTGTFMFVFGMLTPAMPLGAVIAFAGDYIKKKSY